MNQAQTLAPLPADRMPAALAARILETYGSSLLALHAADPAALSFSDNSVLVERMGVHLGLHPAE